MRDRLTWDDLDPVLSGTFVDARSAWECLLDHEQLLHVAIRKAARQQPTSLSFAASEALVADIGKPFVLDRRETEEVSLVVNGSEVVVVWVGDSQPPTRAVGESSPTELTRASSLLPGTVAFRLDDADGFNTVRLEWDEGRVWRVRLYG